MSKENHGGWAFPYQGDQWGNAEFGMTLRDYFAAKALQELIKAQAARSGNGSMSGHGDGRECRSRLSKEAYEFADSMLEARDK